VAALISYHLKPLLFIILANIALLVKMVKVTGAILPKLDLIRVMVVKEALSVHFSVRNAFACLVVAASVHAAFKSRTRFLVDCLDVISLIQHQPWREYIGKD